MNIFERATRAKLRFTTARGELTVEQLWDLPLQAPNNKLDLDTVARGVNQTLKAETEESFVSTTTSPAKVSIELQMDIVKHIIASKIADQDRAKTAASNKAERERLIELLHHKEQQKLAELTPEQIQARLDQLS